MDSEFQIPALGRCWFSAEVLDLSIIGVRLRFDPAQRECCLSKADLEWQDALFKFRSGTDEFILKGHFLMVYEKDGPRFVAGVEFTDMTPEQQFRLVALYAACRRDAVSPQN